VRRKKQKKKRGFETVLSKKATSKQGGRGKEKEKREKSQMRSAFSRRLLACHRKMERRGGEKK